MLRKQHAMSMEAIRLLDKLVWRFRAMLVVL